MFLLVLATSVLVLAGAFRAFDVRQMGMLRASGDSLRLVAAATSARLEAFAIDSVNFAEAVAGFDRRTASLLAELVAAGPALRAAIASRDSARATVALDTLTPQIRAMIGLDRAVAASFRTERDLERALRVSGDAMLARLRERLRRAETLIPALAAERDRALALVSRHEARFDFNLWRLLSEETPQMMACAGGGMAVASINDGDLLIGAGIGVAFCLLKSAVFR